jgi:hypothetical protein
MQAIALCFSCVPAVYNSCITSFKRELSSNLIGSVVVYSYLGRLRKTSWDTRVLYEGLLYTLFLLPRGTRAVARTADQYHMKRCITCI